MPIIKADKRQEQFQQQPWKPVQYRGPMYRGPTRWRPYTGGSENVYAHRNLPANWQRAFYKVPKQFEIYERGGINKWVPEYEPTFWENPVNVARAYNQYKALKPGDTIPEWYDHDAIEAAYKYYEFANKNTPWWEWKYLHPEDPGRQFLQSINQPDLDYILPEEQYQQYAYSTLAGQDPEQWDPKLMSALPPETQQMLMQYQQQARAITPFEELPAWQRVMTEIMSSPATSGIATMAPFALMGGIAGLAGGPVTAALGAGIPLLLGGGLGKLAEASPTAADLLMKLDIPAEWLEQGIGLGMQAVGSLVEPEKYGDWQEFIQNIDAAREAAHLTYAADMRNIPNIPAGIEWLIRTLGDADPEQVQFAQPGQVWVLGQKDPVDIGVYGLAALTQIRNEIIAGRDSQEVIDEWNQRLGFNAQFSELVGHIVLDPLNVLPHATSKGVSLYGRLTGDVAMARAFEHVGPVQGWRKYRTFIRENLGGQYIPDELSAWHLFAGGLNAEGIPKELAIDAVPTNPIKRAFSHLFSMTPDAQARSFTAMQADNWSNVLYTHARRYDPVRGEFVYNVDMGADLARRVAQMTPRQAANLSAELGSASMYVGQRALQGAVPKIDILLEAYHNADPQRALLMRLTDIMQQVDPSISTQNILLRMGSVEDAETFVRQILNQLDQGDPALAAELRASDFTAENVKLMMDVFTGEDPIPWHPEEFASRQLEIIAGTMSEWSAKAYGAKPMGPVSRFFDTLKRAQTFVLLGWNPAYAINNEVSNSVHRAATGIWGYTTNSVIDNLIQRWGVEPYRFEAGIGIAQIAPEVRVTGEVESPIGQPLGSVGVVEAGEMPIRKATRPPKGVADPVRHVVDDANKFAAFSNLSRWFEVQESRQAWYRGITKTWNELHVRGKGFQVMSPFLKNLLLEGGVDPEIVYRAIEGSVSPEEVTVKLGNLRERRRMRYDLHSFLPDVARELGYGLEDAREILSPVFDQLNEKINGARSTDDIVQAFNDVRQHMSDLMDEALSNDLNTRIDQVVQQVKSGGFSEFARLMDGYYWRVEEHWIHHFEEWEATFQLVEQMIEQGASGDAINAQFRLASARANRAWARVDEFQRATIQGAWDALGARRDITATYISKMDDVREVWRGFYNYKNEAYEALWSRRGDMSFDEYQAAKQILEVELNERYAAANSEAAQIAREADGVYVDIITQQFGDDVGAAAVEWRTRIQGLDDVRRQLMTAFREQVIDLSPAERRAAWRAFLEEEYLPAVREFLGQEAEGSYRVWRTATGEEIFRPPPPPEEGPPPEPGQVPPEEPPPQPVGPERPPEEPPAPEGQAVEPSPEELSGIVHREELISVADSYDANIFETLHVVNKYLDGKYGDVAEGWQGHARIERNAFESIEVELARDALEARRLANLEPEPLKRVIPIEEPDVKAGVFDVEPMHYKDHLTQRRQWQYPESGVVPLYHITDADPRAIIESGLRAGANRDVYAHQAPMPISYERYTVEFDANIGAGDMYPRGAVRDPITAYERPDLNTYKTDFDYYGVWHTEGKDIPPEAIKRIYDNVEKRIIYDRDAGVNEIAPPLEEPLVLPEDLRQMAEEAGLTADEIEAIRQGQMSPEQIEEVVNRVTQPRPREIPETARPEGPGAEVPGRRVEPGGGAEPVRGIPEAPGERAPTPVAPGDVGVPEYLRAIVRPDLEYEITNPRVSEILREEMGQQTDLRRIFSNYQRGERGYLLANGTGTGKTYVAMGVIEEMNPKNVLVVMPSRNIFGEWDEAAKLFDRKLAKGSKPPDEGVFLTTYAWLGKNTDKIAGKNYDLIIFDESHRLKGSGQWAQGGEFAISNNPEAKLLFQSATPFQSAGEMEYLKHLNLWDTSDEFGFDRFLMDHNYRWIAQTGGEGFWRFEGTVEDILDIYRQINEKGLGSTRKLIIDQNLDNRFARVALDTKHRQIYMDANRAFDNAMENLHGRYRAMVSAQRTIALRRILEMSKVDDTIKIAQQMLGEGKQVAIFTGYKGELKAPTFRSPRMRHVNGILGEFYAMLSAEEGQTVARLVEALGGEKEVAVITGDVPQRTRKVEIDNYMSGRKKVVVATAASGGTGLSLHDRVGNAPRAQINMYLPWSGQDFEQIAGRSYRYGSASPTTQYWLFGDAPKEAAIAQVVGGRLEEMGGLVSGIEKDFNATKLQAFDFGLLGDERLVDDILSEPIETRRPQVVEGEAAPPPEARPPRYTLKTYEGGKQQYSAYWDSEGNPIENASQEGGRGYYSATYDPDEGWVAGQIDEPFNLEHRYKLLHFEADENGKVNKITRVGSQQKLSQKEYADVIQRIEAKNQEFLSELRQGEAAPLPAPEAPIPGRQAEAELFAPDEEQVREIIGMLQQEQAPVERPAPQAVIPARRTQAPSVVESGKVYDMEFRIYDLNDLITSHTNEMNPTPGFPPELQGRVRERAASQMQVRGYAADLDPNKLLWDTHRINSGPIIIDPNTRYVYSGNGRTITLRIAADEFPENYARYVDQLRREINQYGLTEADLEGIENPILVRELTSEVDPAEFALETNEPETMGYSPFEQALVDARLVTDEMAAQLHISGNQTLDAALTKTANRDFVKSFMANLPENERNKLVDSKGALNPAGVRRIKQAIFARAFPSEAGRTLLELISEGGDTGFVNLSDAVYKSLPDLSRLESKVRSGDVPAQYSLADDLSAALDEYRRVNNEGIRWADYWKQEMLISPVTPFQRELLRYLFENNRKINKTVVPLLREYIERALSQPGAEQFTMFEVPAKSRIAIWREAINAIHTGDEADIWLAHFENIQEEAPRIERPTATIPGEAEAPPGELEEPIAGVAGGGGEGPPEVPPEAPAAEPEGPRGPRRRARIGDRIRSLTGVEGEVLEVLPDAPNGAQRVRVRMDNGETRIVQGVSIEITQEGPPEPVVRPEPIIPEVTPETAPALGPQPAGAAEDVMGSPYFRTVQDWDAWQQRTVPVLDTLQERILADGQPEANFANLSEQGRRELNNYLKSVSSDMASERIATQRWAESLRDQALLNYSKRLGIDNYLTPLFPYQFWYTRSMFEWAMRAFDRPKWFANYARLRDFQRNTMKQPGFPSRMRDKMTVSAPFLPEWTGGKVWVDPVGKSFPFQEFMRPIDLHAQDKDQVTRRAESILSQWGNEGVAGNRDIALAVATRSGELWSRAVAEAQKQLDNGEPSPFDFMDLILSPALYLTLPTFLATGKDPLSGREDIPLLPITRTGKSIQAVTKNTPLHALGQMVGGIMSWPESAWRKGRGLSEFGDWGNYYVDRQLTNMAAEGYDTKEILIAMNERQGPLYDEAVNRVELETALRVPGSLPAYGALHGGTGPEMLAATMFGWLPAGLLPEGELQQRGLAQLYKSAREQYNKGDSEAFNRFLEEHPEYEARLALWDEPQERLRQFLVSEVWDSYSDLSRVDKQKAREELGDLFTDGFMGSKTGDYNEFDVPTLAYFANYLHGQVPETPETAMITETPDIMQDKLQLAPPDEAQAVNAYRTLREQLFPNWYALQTWYFSLDKGERKKFLARFPMLVDYWDWNKAYKKENPVIGKYTRKPSEDEINYPQAYDYSFVQEFSPALSRQLLSYFYAGRPLTNGTTTELQYIWEQYGRPGGSYDTFLNEVLHDIFAP